MSWNAPAFEEWVRQECPDVAIVLGSGLGEIADRVAVQARVRFQEFPGFPAASVQGHAGEFVLGSWAGRSRLIVSGRLHFYEGLSADSVFAPIRLLAKWGVGIIVFTNAAGGIRADLQPGTLMAITSHLDWTGSRPAARPSPEPIYSSTLRERIQQAAHALGDSLGEPSGDSLAQGTYAAVLGPNYETPAEIRALERCGADAVGMSTAREAAFARSLGLECAAISCITNRAAGLANTPLTHREVLENSRRQSHRLGNLLERLLLTN
jgi:purine-nucleoside phosphorylase